MNVFIDSSALVKIFLNESGSDKVTGLIIHPKTQTWILDLAHAYLLTSKIVQGLIRGVEFSAVMSARKDNLS